jgi:dolichol-phosphate mannosyltransferase
MKIAIVIAAYDEADTIGPLTARLLTVMDSMEACSWHLIYVIEGTDGTVEIARSFALDRPEIEIIYHERPNGLGRAFMRGFQSVPAGSDFIITMDADLNHQPEEIPRMLAAAVQTGADIVVGSRRINEAKISGMPVWKDALSRTVNRMMQYVMGVRINDLTSGFRVYRADALRRIHFESVGFAFLPEILIDATCRRLKIVEEPIHFVVREVGQSKLQVLATSVSYLRLFARRSIGVSWFHTRKDP